MTRPYRTPRTLLLLLLFLAVPVLLLRWEGADSDLEARAGGDVGEELGASPSTLYTDASTIPEPALAATPVGGSRTPFAAADAPPAEGASPSPSTHARGRDHAAVRALAEHHGLSPEAVVAELEVVWPQLLELEVKPLQPWAAFEPNLPSRIQAELVGGTPKVAEAIFESAVLGRSLKARLAETAEAGIDPAGADDLRWRCREVLDGVRAEYDEYTRRLVEAFATKIVRADFDRSPYVMLRNRTNTDVKGRDKLYSYGGAFADSCWSVSVDIYAGEFPELERARDVWLDARDRAEAALADVLPDPEARIASRGR